MGVRDDPCERIKTNSCAFSVQSQDTPRDASSDEVATISSIGESSCLKVVEIEQTVSLPADMMRKKDIEVLRVEGDSIIDDHLLNGDLLIIERGNTARDGKMVVALLRNRWTTVKRFFN